MLPCLSHLLDVLFQLSTQLEKRRTASGLHRQSDRRQKSWAAGRVCAGGFFKRALQLDGVRSPQSWKLVTGFIFRITDLVGREECRGHCYRRSGFQAFHLPVSWVLCPSLHSCRGSPVMVLFCLLYMFCFVAPMSIHVWV